MSGYTEDHLIEQPAIQLMEHELGWDSVNAYDEWSSGVSNLGREAKREVVLTGRLKPALQSLNPELPAEALDAAVEELTRDRSALSLVEANREIDKLLRGGVKVTIPDRERGGQRVVVVRVIDWDDAAANDFLLVSQFWITGDLYTRRTDLIGFVNGLPLVLIELKKPGVNVREAFDKNLADYKETIPQLFHYNGFLLVSNGVQSKIGSLTAEWERFGDWKKVAEEKETPDISLNTLLRGTCEKSRLLDLVENFTRFSESKGAVGKLVARNHQFLGVNRAVEALKTTEDGRVGVFWHTQGSGKSYSMVFFSEKVFREMVKFSKDLNEEEQRHLREPKETEAIKMVCKDLLAKLKTELLVLAWRNKRTRAPQCGSRSRRCWLPGCRRNTRPTFSRRSAECSSSTCWRSIQIKARVCMGKRVESSGRDSLGEI